ncbi:hypothetical protein [Eisenbergiella sp.]
MNLTNHKKIPVKGNEIFYFLFLIIMAAAKGLGYYEGMKPYNLCVILAGICIFVKVISEKYNILEIIIDAILVLIGLIVYRETGEQSQLFFIAIVIGMKNISIKRVFFVEGFVWSGCFLIRCVLGMSGLSRGLVLVHEKLGLGPIIRWSFGYPHPNVLQITYAIVVAIILYNVNYEGKKLFRLLCGLFVGNCIIFLYSVSYTGFILTTGLLLIYLYFIIRKKRSKLENILIQSVLPVSIFFSVILPLAMEQGSILGSLDGFMNELFNTRFLASRVYLYEGPGLFGRDVSRIGFALDCSYVYLLMKNGIILFTVIVSGYFILVHQYVKQNKNKELSIIIIFLIAGISEPFLFNTSFKNITFFFLGDLMYKFLDRNWKTFGILDLNGIKYDISVLSGVSNILIDLYKHNRKIIYTAGGIGAILSIVIYFFVYSEPEAIFVLSGNTDCGKREEYFLTQNDFQNPDYIVYEYHGEHEPMYRFENTTVYLEGFRDGISVIIWGSLIGIIVIFVICFIGMIMKKNREGIKV